MLDPNPCSAYAIRPDDALPPPHGSPLMTERNAAPRSRDSWRVSGSVALQTHGQTSRVYVPILRKIFAGKYREGAVAIEFDLDDIRKASEDLGIVVRNPADLVYRMRSRTVLPKEILDAGFYVLRQVGRGKYRLEKATSTIIEVPETEPQQALDLTPLPVRRLLPEALAEFDEQALLTVVNYCKLLDHFTSLTVYRLRSHVRKSVVGIGQAELDELDVGVAISDDEIPIVFPIEAKAAPDAINRVQIAAMVAFTDDYFPGYKVRPLVVKVTRDSLVHCIEFNATKEPAELKVLRAQSYRLAPTKKQLEAIRQSAVKVIRQVSE